MKDHVEKVKPISDTAINLMQEHNVQVKVGDKVMCKRYGDVYRASVIDKKGVTLMSSNDHDDGEHVYGTIEFDRFNDEYLVLEKPIEEYEKDLMEALQDPSKLVLKEDEVPSDTQALVVQNSAQNVLQLQSRLQAMEKGISIMTSMLERKKNSLQHILHKYTEAVQKVTKVIHTLELYLGIGEDIVQIGEGRPASEQEPISIRQQVLYMDEEFGDDRNQGLDFRSLEVFDQWIISDPRHFNRVLPEQKGIVCLRVRRKDKDYGVDRVTNFFLNLENQKTYFLIRNGLNFYRIWADVEVGSRLFPKKDELDPRNKGDRFGFFDEKKLEEKSFSYKQKAIMLQGLIDRTQIFAPHAPGLSLFKPDSYKDGIRLIADAELLLPSGRLSFRDWQKDINSKIDRGTRVLWALGAYGGGYSKKNEADRFERYYNEWNIPDLPATGVYSVVETSNMNADKTGARRLYHYRELKNMGKIIYNPKDTVRDNSWRHWADRVEDHERKRGLGIWFGFDEHFILNYDLVSLDDVEFYLENRTDRPNYLRMMHVLRNIRRMRLEEIKHERQFVEAMAERLPIEDKKLALERLWEAVAWWKTKVIWKRPLDKDDSKAWRMIRQRVLGEIEPK